MLIFNSPSNPTGVVYDEKELKQIAAICLKHNIYILSDEIYEKLIYGKKHVSIASVNEKLKINHRRQWCFKILCDDRVENRACGG